MKTSISHPETPGSTCKGTPRISGGEGSGKEPSLRETTSAAAPKEMGKRFPSRSYLVSLLPAKADLVHNRIALVRSCRDVILTIIPMDYYILQNITDDEIDFQLGDAATNTYDKKYQYDLVDCLIERFAATKHPNSFPTAFFESIRAGRMRYDKPGASRNTQNQWITHMWTFNAHEKHLFRGSAKTITQYNQRWALYRDCVDDFIDKAAPYSGTPHIGPVVEQKPVIAADTLQLPARDGGVDDVKPSDELDDTLRDFAEMFQDGTKLQTITDEAQVVPLEIVGGEQATVDVMACGTSTATLTLFTPEVLPEDPPVDKTEVISVIERALDEKISRKIRTEILTSDAPEGVHPVTICNPLFVLIFMALLLFLAVMPKFLLWWYGDTIFTVEQLITPDHIVIQRLWGAASIRTRIEYLWISTVTQYWINPISVLVNTVYSYLMYPLVLLSTPAPNYTVFGVEDQTFLLDFQLLPVHTTERILRAAFGNAAYESASTVVTRRMTWWLYEFLSYYQLLLFFILGMTMLGFSIFGFGFFAPHLWLARLKMKARHRHWAQLIDWGYFTMSVERGSTELVEKLTDQRPLSMKIGKCDTLDYAVANVHVTITQDVCPRYVRKFLSWFGRPLLGVRIDSKYEYDMKVLPDLLSMTLDVKSLTALSMNDYISRVRQVMNSTVTYNYDKDLILDYENLAMNTFLYAAVIKKVDEDARLGNFPRELWTQVPARSTE